MTASDEGTDAEIFVGGGENSDVDGMLEEYGGLVTKLEAWADSGHYLKGNAETLLSKSLDGATIDGETKPSKAQ